MGGVVYVPFAASLLVAAVSRVGARRLWPAAAVWAMTVAAAVLALSTAGALVLLACPLLAQVPLVATLGRWRPRAIAVHTPTPGWISLVALGVLFVSAVRTWRGLRRVASEWVDARALRAATGRGVVVIPRDIPGAHAVPGGTVVVTTSMVALLDGEERAAVIAHEWAHIRRRHHLFLVLAQLANAVDPFLAGIPADLHFALERWADEDAAASTTRPALASALTKTALAAFARAGTVAQPGLAFGRFGVTDRVAALLAEPNHRSRPAWAIVALAILAAVALAWATHDTERFFEAARVWSYGRRF